MKRIITSVLIVLTGLSAAQAQGDAYFVKQTDQIFYTDKKTFPAYTSKKDKEKQQDVLQVLQEKQRKENTGNVGSPLFYNGWSEGVFRLSGGQEIKGKMALDISRNTLFYEEIHRNAILCLKPKWVNIYGHELQRYDNEFTNAGDFYYEKLPLASVLILKKYSCQYEDFGKDINTGYNYLNAKGYNGARNNQLYLIKDRKKFYQIFGRKGNKVKEFVLRNKLNLGAQQDVLALASFIENF